MLLPTQPLADTAVSVYTVVRGAVPVLVSVMVGWALEVLLSPVLGDQL